MRESESLGGWPRRTVTYPVMTAGFRYIRSLSVTSGRHTFSQRQLAEQLRARLGHLPESRQLAQRVAIIYEQSGIRQRHFELDPASVGQRPDWYRAVNEATLALASRALTALFAKSGESAADCDALVVVSASYSGFPSLGRRLQERFGFPRQALCFDLSGLGCAGTPQGLYLADLLLTTGRCQSVCLLCVDAMGVYSESRHHCETPTVSQLVAHCLASDGAAALVLSRLGPTSQSLLRYCSSTLDTELWQGAMDQNDLTADAHNQPFLSVGKDLRTRLLAECQPYFTPQTLNSPLLLHPGGMALMKSLGDHYPQLRDTVALSSAVLAENGNVGSPSVLFVLDAALRGGVPLGPRLGLFALGPGIVTTLLRLESVATASA